MSALDELRRKIGKGMGNIFGISKEDINRLRDNMEQVVSELKSINRKLDKIIRLLEGVKHG